MGKDQELLEAARCGNISVVEKILSQRAKKSGPLASLRRGPGPNVQDNNGYTPLHHACLNGHKDIVSLLLSHEASASIVDQKGCTPLHLAAWSGYSEIVELLLKSGTAVNHMNFDHESALHSAAQYGHTDIVKLLLENKCYPSVRNVRNESPLDLASQYGRLETVQCLLNSHPNFISDIVRCHSPLHLASKNGHKHVVKLLLDSGFDINYMTDIGTALHEAALCGKLEVVKLLLDYGVDPSLKNFRNRSVFDILGDLNTSVAKQIKSVIEDHMTIIKLDNGSDDTLSSISPPDGFVSASHFDVLQPERKLPKITPPRQFCSPYFDDFLYDVPPPPRPVNQDTLSVNESLLYEIPPPSSFLSTKRYSDPLQPSLVHQNVIHDEKDIRFKASWTPQHSYIPMMAANLSSNIPLQPPPAKPPRKSVSPQSSEAKNNSQRNNYEYSCLTSSGLHNCSPKILDKNKNNGFVYTDPYSNPEYVDMSLESKIVPLYENHEILCTNGLDTNPFHSHVDTADLKHDSTDEFSEVSTQLFFSEDGYRKGSPFNNLMPSRSTPALYASRHTLDQVVLSTSKEFPPQMPPNLNLVRKRTLHFPTSPTNYNQPPTPDNPPPSPGTAEIGLHEKIHPVGQNLKKKLPSRDVETLTDEQLVATLGPYGEVELTLATDNKCISTDSEKNSNPFAGLHYGSASSTLGLKTHRSLLNNQRGPVSSKSQNIYENVQLVMDVDSNKDLMSTNNCEVPADNCSLSAMSPFDEKAEWAEIAGIMASFGGSITQELESHFAQALKTESPNSQKSSLDNNLASWLSKIGLSQYENLLIINGFDDINFMGGKIVEDEDLKLIGIKNSLDREKLCLAAKKLPAIVPLSAYRETDKFPKSVDEWLNSLNLQEYSGKFSSNNITNLDRASKLWEVEVFSVLKIPKIGHSKRLLASLDGKCVNPVVDSRELDISKLTLNISDHKVDDQSIKCTIKKDASLSGFDNCVKDPVSNSYLPIRSPTQLMGEDVDDEGYSRLQPPWPHHPDELVINSCNYIAKYLGSTLVKELNGVQSTRNSIQKLKASTKDIAKIPSIILSISYKGVKFINAENQQLVCEHEILHMHSACQDDDLKYFAYITSDPQKHNHYCHVFSSHTVEVASEIMMTIGQAFEVAYQIAMKAKADRASNTGQRIYENVKRTSS